MMTAIRLRVDSTLKSRRLVFAFVLLRAEKSLSCGIIAFEFARRWNCITLSKSAPVCSNNGVGRARSFHSAIKFAALAALSVHAKSILHQFAAPAARGCPLVNTTPVTVSATHGVRTGRPQAELCKLRVCQERACTRSKTIYIYLRVRHRA